ARALAVPTPMRKPVNEPGPSATATPSGLSSGPKPASASTRSTVGIRRSEWVVRCKFSVYSPVSRSPSTTATPPVSVDVSNPITRTTGPFLLPRLPQRGHPAGGFGSQRPKRDATPGTARGVARRDGDVQPLRGQFVPHPAAPLDGRHAVSREVF